MAITYPNTLDELSNPASTDPLTGHAAQHANVNDAIEALEIKVGITGSADTDSLDYKAAAATAHIAASAPHAGHATTSGKSGGQTLIGGTAASETLTLRSTAHATKGSIILGTLSVYDEVNERLGIGATAPSARMHAVSQTEQLRLGYDAANYETTTVSSTGVVARTSTGGRWTYRGVNSTATLGADLITDGDFSISLSGWEDSGSSWSWSAGTALHTAGSASTLTKNVSVESGNTYQIEFTISGRTAGSVALALGAVSVIDSGAVTAFTASAKRTVVAGASGSVALVVTPTSDFDGAVDAVTLKLVALGSVTPSIVLLDSDGAVGCEIRQTAQALQSMAFGAYSQRSLTTGIYDTAIGSYAQYSLTTGSYDTAIGSYAQYSLTTGSYDTAIGLYAQYSLTTGSYDTAIGYLAQRSLTTGSYDTAIGSYAQRSLTTGIYDTAIGSCAQSSLTTGSYDTAIGYYAQYSLTTGSYDIAIGSSAQNSLTTGNNDTAIGSYAQYSLTTGSYDIAIGYYAQYSLTTGSYDIAIGSYAQNSLTTGSYDIAIGSYAQNSLTTGNNDTAIGYYAQRALTTGGSDTAVGHFAQRYLPDGTTEVQVFNNCTHIGAGTRVSAENATNETAVGYQAIGIGSNTVTLGNLNVTRTGLRGSVEIIASSSTTASQIQGALAASWVDSTHATRKARLVISAYDTAAREAIRVEGSGTAPLIGFYGADAVAKPTALTTQLPALTYTAPGTPDYAIAAVTQTTPYGFTTADEAHTVLSVIKNLQDRVSQLETKLQALGLLT